MARSCIRRPERRLSPCNRRTWLPRVGDLHSVGPGVDPPGEERCCCSSPWFTVLGVLPAIPPWARVGDTHPSARMGRRENYSSLEFARRLPWGCGGGAPWATEVAALVAAVRCDPLRGREGGSPLLGRAISSSPRVGFVVLFLLDGVAVAALEVLRCFLDSPL